MASFHCLRFPKEMINYSCVPINVLNWDQVVIFVTLYMPANKGGKVANEQTLKVRF